MRDIRAIGNEAEYDRALAEIAFYFETQPVPGTEAAERFDVLADLIKAYEDKYWSVEPADRLKSAR